MPTVTRTPIGRTNTLATQLVLDKLAGAEGDENLVEITHSLNEQLKTLSELRQDLVDDKILFLQAKYRYDTEYARLIQSAEGSNEKARVGWTESQLKDLNGAMHEAEIALENTRAAFEIEEYGWKLMRHILAAKYGGVYGSATSGDVG